MHSKDPTPAARSSNLSRRAEVLAALHAALAEHAEALAAYPDDPSDTAARRLTVAEATLAQRCAQATPLYWDASATRAVMRVLAVYLNASASERETQEES